MEATVLWRNFERATGVNCHKLIGTRMCDAVLVKLDMTKNRDVQVAVTVMGAWAQNLSLCMRLLRVQCRVVTLQINQQPNV